jgi:hypothetical protein
MERSCNLVNNRPEGTTYSNVTFTYTDLHSLNVVAEVVNELHKKEEAKVASQ